VVTPETVYPSCNVEHYDYTRKADAGLGILVIDVWLVEIRTAQTAAFTNTATPAVGGTQGIGAVQPIGATAQQTSYVSDGGIY
jgi:hypothetical protein